MINRKSKKSRRQVEEMHILNGLEDVLKKLDIQLKYERGGFRGGLCRIDDKEYFYLSKILSLEQKISIISHQLKNLNLENIYLKPQIRELLEN